jgi:hypothetical protein
VCFFNLNDIPTAWEAAQIDVTVPNKEMQELYIGVHCGYKIIIMRGENCNFFLTQETKISVTRNLYCTS